MSAHLDDSDITKVTSGQDMVGVTWVQDAMDMASGTRPRVYAYLDRGEYAGQVVSIKSHHNLSTHRANVQFYWTSDMTIADLIERIA